MFNNNNGYSLSDIAAATGGNRENNGLGGDGAWILLLFIIVLMGGWNNNGWGGNGGGGTTYVASDIQRGFDQAAVTTGITNLATSLCNGFSDVQQSLCNGFAQAEIANNARQIADMQQDFALQTALSNQLNTIGMNQQECCCQNRAAVADLKYTVANEACADRAAVDSALRDIITNQTANTQRILDQLCQDKIDAKNELIANLRQEIAMKDLAASQTAQNAFIAQGLANEVDQLYNRLNTCPVPTTPVYGRTPIFTCNNNGWNEGCGCGNGAFYN